MILVFLQPIFQKATQPFHSMDSVFDQERLQYRITTQEKSNIWLYCSLTALLSSAFFFFPQAFAKFLILLHGF